jgi:hypothetical protein
VPAVTNRCVDFAWVDWIVAVLTYVQMNFHGQTRYCGLGYDSNYPEHEHRSTFGGIKCKGFSVGYQERRVGRLPAARHTEALRPTPQTK